MTTENIESMIGTSPKEWDAYFKTQDYPAEYVGNPAILREICSLFPIMKGRSVLEVGPGSGRDSAQLANDGALCTILDPTPTCVRKIKSAYPAIRCVQGDGFSMPFESQVFDLVFSQGLLEHFPDPLQMLREQVRVTKVGGFTLVDVPQTFSLWTVKKKVLQALGRWFVSYETQYSESGLRRLISRVDEVRVIRFYGHKLLPSWLFPQPRSSTFARTWMARHVCACIGVVLQRIR